MKKTNKWPSRAFNLLMVLAMVISLSAILVAPPVAAAGQIETPCNPTPVYNGCHLDVAVSTYIKDSEGNFQPKGNFTPGECFYVNAVVVNDGNATAYGPINATISWIDGIGSADGIEFADGQGNLTTWEGNLTGWLPPGAGAIADFWWQVCCLAADGNNTISVNATPAISCEAQRCPAEGSTIVNQTVTEAHPCLEIEIVEAPGMSDKVGHLLDGEGDPIVYHSALLNTVSICQNFGIKAEITNNCDYEIHELNGTIDWTGPASIVGGDPESWRLADPLLPGQTVAVAWTLHCDGPGDVLVNVTATGTAESNPSIIGDLDPITYGNNSWTVHQASEGGVTIKIIQPVATEDCAGVPLEIKQASGCGSNKFLVVGNVTNTGDNPLGGVLVQVFATPSSGWVTLPAITWQAVSLAPHEWKLVTFGNFTCIGLGLGNITMTASPTGLPTVSAFVTIDQKNIIATISPPVIQAGNTTPDWPLLAGVAGPVNPDEVNKCQTFGISYRYTNYAAVPWDLSNGNITACINWENGDNSDHNNAAFTGQIWYRRIETGQAAPWELLPGLSDQAKLGNLTDISGQACNNITATTSTPVICPCCAVDVLWVFQCIHAAPCFDSTETVAFNSTITVQQTAPPSLGTINGSDTSPSVCVDQVWKAHLTADVLFFAQDDKGIMTVQGAVVPGTEFHVVMPVINTGDATAENVQVHFYTTTGNATIGSYTYLSYSGDGSVSYTYNAQTGQGNGTASLGDIPGHSAKKAILLIRCNSEGELDITIPTSQGGTWASAQGLGTAQGVRATDENTHTWVPQANIVVPNCPEVLQQIPFTVQIENPITCQTYNEGDVFPVKALIHNGSSDPLGLVGVLATINIDGNATLVDVQENPKFVGNMTPLSYSEITWMLRCTGGGDVEISVSATLPEPLLIATSDIVTVHQIAVAAPELNVIIMSPQDSFGHQPPFADIDGTYIGTGEQFAVTALVTNSGDGTAHDVQAIIAANRDNQDNADNCVWTDLGAADGNTTSFYIHRGCVTPGSVIMYFNENFDEPLSSGNYTVIYNIAAGGDGWYTQITFNSPPAAGTEVYAVFLASMKLIDGQEMVSLGDILPGGYATYTWTMVATTSCEEQCTTLPVNIDVAAISADTLAPKSKDSLMVNFTYDCDEIDVFVYPAAHLVVDITPPDPSTISVGSQFTVGYTVTNIGQSDAWNASVTLSVDPAVSVCIAAGAATQRLGTITGTLTSPDNSVSGNFTLVSCNNQACASSITITPMGYDECGYGPVWAQDCRHGTCRNDYTWEGVPGTAIQGKFLEPAGTTVQQVANGLDIGITKRADKSMASNGTTVQFTVQVTNNGPIAGSSIVVTDSWTTSGFTSPTVVSKSQGSAPVFGANGFTWNVGSLAVSGTATLVYSAVSHSNGKIVNTATVASAEGDGYPNNNTASVELNVSSMQFALRAGWNLISLPLIPGNTTTEAVLSSLPGGSVNKVWGYSATTGWSSRIPGVSGTLTQMTDGWGYWIYMNSAQTLTITGTELPAPPSAGGQPSVPPSYDVVPGWNLIGFKSTTAKPEGVYLAAIAGVYTKVYGFSQGLYFTVVSGDNLQPGMGYWIAIVPPGGTIFP